MTPKTPKDFIKPTAEALGQSESLVDDIVSFYWLAVRKALSDIEGPSITVTNLGTFKIKYNRISKLEKKYQTYLDNLEVENMTFNKHTIQNLSKNKLEALNKAREEMLSEFARREKTRAKRRDYVTNKTVEE